MEANLRKLAFMATKSLFTRLQNRMNLPPQATQPSTYVSLLSSIIEPLLPATETVTRPRLAAREDLDAAADAQKNWKRDAELRLTFGYALLPEPVDCFGSITIAGFQRLFAVQHGSTRAIAQNFHICGRH